jgi:hypothetical protein
MTSVRLKDTTDVVRRAAWVGATEPTSDDTVTVGPGTLWIDDSTTPNVLKRRNDTDDGWVAVGLVTGTTATTAAAGNHNHTHDSLTGRTTDNHHAKAHNVGDAAAHPDVLVTSPATGDALVYDATAVKWKNVPVAGGVTLSSANPTTAAPSDAAGPGTGLSATRGDHRHGMPATWPPSSHAHSAHSGLGADDHTQYQLRSERAAASGYAPLDSGLLVPVANLGTGTPTGSKFLRDDRTWAVPAGSGGGSLTIEELDGTPSVAAATKLIFPNGTVSVTGTEATYTPSGGGSSPTFHGARVVRNGSTSVANATYVQIFFNVERFDSDGFHDTGTNINRFTIPSGLAGKYLVGAQVQWDANASGFRQLVLNHSSAGFIALEDDDDGGAVGLLQTLVTLWDFAVGDWVEVQVGQNSGASRSLPWNDKYTPEFWITYLGA